MDTIAEEKKLQKDQRDEKIVKMRLAGYKVKEIASIVGLTHARVSQICKERGVSIPLEKVEGKS